MFPFPIDLQIYADETALLGGLRRRDPDACTCLLKHYTPRIYARAMQIVGDADEADSVLQQTLIQACRKFESFDERSSLGTWLYRIATNEALMSLRQRRTTPLDDLPEPIDLQPGDQPLQAALDSELRAELAAALALLPENQRAVFVLRELEGLSTEQAAAELGINTSAAKVRLHRARLRLRELLAAYHEQA